MTIEKKVWGYDPRWIRCEAFDASGNSLDHVWFEPNDAADAMAVAGDSRRTPFPRRRVAMAATVLVSVLAAVTIALFVGG